MKIEKKKDYVIVIPQPTQSNLQFALDLIAKDNPSLETQIKEILEAYTI